LLSYVQNTERTLNEFYENMKIVGIFFYLKEFISSSVIIFTELVLRPTKGRGKRQKIT